MRLRDWGKSDWGREGKRNGEGRGKRLGEEREWDFRSEEEEKRREED